MKEKNDLPNILIFKLERLKSEDGFKKILSQNISFQKEVIIIKSVHYQLIGITTINSDINYYQNYTKYMTYIKLENDDEWI